MANPFAPPMVDFSPLGQLGQIYFSSQDAARKRRQEDEVPGLIAGIPGLFGGADTVNTTPLKTTVQSDQVSSSPKTPSFVAAQGGSPSRNISGVIASAAEKYGLDPGYMSKLAMVESGGRADAANPNSSASGLFQFIKSTAQQYGLANPLDPVASSDAAARLTLDNKAALRQALGRDPTPGELYLAHQQGAGGASKILSNPNARAVDLVGADAIRLNGGSPDMTAGQFAQRWTSKFDNPADVPAAGATEAQFQIPGQGGGAAARMTPQQREYLTRLAANPATRPMATQLLQKMMEPEKFGFQTAGDQLYRTNPRTGQAEAIAPAQKPTSDIQEYNLYREQGGTDTFTNWARANKAAGATKVDVNTAGEKKFQETASTGIAKRFEKLSEEGDAGQTDLALTQELRGLADRIQTGPVAALQGVAARYGLKIGDNVSEIEAFSSLVDRLTPQQRVPGSGATSDFEMRTFKNALPSLIRTPEGNALAMDTMQALAQSKVARAQIAERALTDEITPQEAIRQLRALPDPMAAFRAARGNNPGLGKPAEKPQGGQGGSAVLDAARDAIRRGAPRDAVLQRLRERGIDASGL